MKIKSLLSLVLGVLAALVLAFSFFFAPRETLSVLVLPLVVAALVFVVANVSRQSRRGALNAAINTNPGNFGTHAGGRTFYSSAALATRYLLGKVGADKDHIAVVAATADEPIGVMTDEASAAEEPVGVEPLGNSLRTLPVVASAAIALDVDLYQTATGKVSIKPTVAGTYWKVGKSVEASTADGDVIEMIPQKPRKLIVLAALTSVAGDIADTNSTAVNPTKSDFDSLLVAAGKLQADFHLLTTALNSGADVAYAA